jgi:oligoribonuclease
MKSPSNLVWLDLEMSGLHPEKDVIIEVASLVTDAQLNILAEGPTVAVHQSEEVLAAMDEWCTATHTASGLVQRVLESTTSIEEAEAQTLSFLSEWVESGTSPLCGNSIGHDRRFVRIYMPGFEAFLHYRNIDVSSIKELVRRWYPESMRPPPKKGVHLALDDIRESVAELRWYRDHVFVPPPSE